MILKKFKKSVALALAIITISIPISNLVYANENYKIGQPNISLNNINIDEIYNAFNNLESNVARRNNSNSDIDYQYKTNFFENLEIMEEQFKSPRAVIDTNSTLGPTDDLYYKVDRQSRDMITIKNTKGSTKNYSKTIKTYYTGNTKGFIDNVDRTDSYLGKLYGGMGTSAAVTFLAYLGLSTGPIGLSVVKSVLASLGLGTLSSMATNILNNYNDYTYSTRQANHFYNSI